MPVVIIMLIAIGAAAVLAVWCLHWFRSLELERIAAQEDGQEFSVLPLSLAFDPDCAVIWDTQLPALRMVGFAGGRGLELSRLCGCYAKAAHRYPELYDGSSFQQWVEFLQRAQLIACKDNRAVLTPEGRDFLHYRVAAEAVGAPAMRVAA